MRFGSVVGTGAPLPTRSRKPAPRPCGGSSPTLVQLKKFSIFSGSVGIWRPLLILPSTTS